MTMPSVLTNNLPPSSASQLTTTSGTATSNNQLGPDSFITLLTAQLQAQDPLNPMDPSEMVDQLTQINSLQQLVQIQSDLQQVLGETPSGSQTGTQTGTQANAT
jgi:flagellar basal-body rod modification protein FlgD